MLKRIKFKNSTILFIGILIIIIGVCIGLSEYFIERKSKVYSCIIYIGIAKCYEYIEYAWRN